MSLAEQMFDGGHAEARLECMLEGVPFERLGWDHYDCSLELHDVPADYRLPDDMQKVIHDAGFAKVYVNHVDKWETHYSWRGPEFAAVKGWRVSYPHKRGAVVVHELKTWPEFFAQLASGEKTFELRRDDRDFNVGDLLRLREFDPATKEYSGRELYEKVSHILRHTPGKGCAAEFGLAPGFAILSLSN